MLMMLIMMVVAVFLGVCVIAPLFVMIWENVIRVCSGQEIRDM